jgi:hypothetical protein
MLSKVFAKLSGRTTAFCSAFFLTGHVLAWLHRLDATYIGFMVALLGAVIGHSVKEDIFPQKEDVKQ